jgi:hypothetical protein
MLKFEVFDVDDGDLPRVCDLVGTSTVALSKLVKNANDGTAASAVLQLTAAAV